MDWIHGYVLGMGLFLASAVVIRFTTFVHKTSHNPLVVGKGKQGWAKYWEKLSTAGLFLAFGFVLAYCAYFSAMVDRHFPVWEHRYLFYPQLAGYLLLPAGCLLLVLAFFHMGQSWRIGIDLQTQDRLVTTGIFAYTRNPIFLGIDCFWIGVALIFPQILFVSIAIAVILGTHLQIRAEERFLKIKYGTEYEAYTARTGRYWTVSCGW